MAAEPVLQNQADLASRYLARSAGVSWLVPSQPRTIEELQQQVDLHRRRLIQVIPDAADWMPSKLVLLNVTPHVAAFKAGADARWRRALTRSAGHAINVLAQQAGPVPQHSLHAVDELWTAVSDHVMGDVVTAGNRAWVAGIRSMKGPRSAWRQQATLMLDPSATVPARIAAKHAAFHHATDALWWAADLDGSPAAPMNTLWHWGYWPLGPDGRGGFLVRG